MWWGGWCHGNLVMRGHPTPPAQYYDNICSPCDNGPLSPGTRVTPPVIGSHSGHSVQCVASTTQIPSWMGHMICRWFHLDVRKIHNVCTRFVQSPGIPVGVVYRISNLSLTPLPQIISLLIPSLCCYTNPTLHSLIQTLSDRDFNTPNITATSKTSKNSKPTWSKDYVD